jgi:hypothetical protein
MTDSASAQDSRDGARDPTVLAELFAELLSAGGGDRVIPRLPLRRRLAPFGLDPTASLEAVEGGVERPLLDAQHVLREAPDVLGDGVAVHRAECQRVEDEEVERAGEKRRHRQTGYR